MFSSDFLHDAIIRLNDWLSIDEFTLHRLKSDLRKIFDRFPTTKNPNESQTEDDLIWPILVRLGWVASLRQQNLAPRGREDVPDGLLFADDAAKARANSFREEWRRYGFGLALVEAKRWQRPLDRRSGRRGEETAPSTQMLRYLRRVDDLTTGKLRWGILTNGGRWRLYYQGARSVSEQFFEINLTAILDLPGHNDGLFALAETEQLHWLKVFALVFRRDAFLPTPSDHRTFHQRALEEGRFYEERVATNLSNMVFGYVFSGVSRAIADAAPTAPLQEVREAALILLYRLLFILYAEDRDLLPVRDRRYDDYGLRERVREDVGRRKDCNDTFSATATRYWSALDDLCRAINAGDGSIGLPPYNGGLFNPDRTPLLAQVRLGDAIMANVIDALCFEQTPDGRKYINYRDLSVQQLGSIYERLLEHEVTREDGEIVIRPNISARRSSGSYYTPGDLVALILEETIEPLVSARMNAFMVTFEELSASTIAEDRRIGKLKQLDPAQKLLELKICDPAMGSGHFLVSLVDYLADQVIAAMAEAESLVADYVSPLSDRIDAIRNTILGNAEARGWTIDPEQLDDRHIIRRMVLKRCIYGVDKNLMAVELAKVSLWLHTFTVGAPLSFLDHHLRCGDSLFGSWVREGIDKATSYGVPLLLHNPITRAMRAASPMKIIEGLTDAEIAEAHGHLRKLTNP
ncbi:MAG: Eco57I restriction-modification methylase domain-containing protein, partial [Limisphaerales bacterium]